MSLAREQWLAASSSSASAAPGPAPAPERRWLVPPPPNCGGILRAVAAGAMPYEGIAAAAAPSCPRAAPVAECPTDGPLRPRPARAAALAAAKEAPPGARGCMDGCAATATATALLAGMAFADDDPGMIQTEPTSATTLRPATEDAPAVRFLIHASASIGRRVGDVARCCACIDPMPVTLVAGAAAG